MSTRSLTALGAALLLAQAAGCGTANEPQPTRRPSILFLSIDTLSAGRMSLYGYDRPTTPELERLAAEAFVFEDCSSNAPWTTPSYASQLTGLQAESFFTSPASGHVDQDWVLPLGADSLAEVLGTAGYRTAAFIDNLHLGRDRGFAQGFEVFDESAARLGVDARAGGLRASSRAGLDWLDGLEGDAPWFLFVQAADTHGPYLASGSPEGLFPPRPTPDPDLELPLSLGNLNGFDVVMEYIARPVFGEEADRARVADLVDAYDEGVRRLDSDLAAFFTALEERGLRDEVVVVLSADHGESLGRHGSWFDHALLNREVLHVPLVVWLPGERQGRRVPGSVQLVDLVPTLLDLADVPAPGPLHGRSLVDAMAGEPLEPRPVLAVGSFERARSITVDGWKLVETSPSVATSSLTGLFTSPRGRAWIAEQAPHLEGKAFGTPELSVQDLAGLDLDALIAEAEAALAGPWYQLYHVAADPGEVQDLAPAHPDRVAELRELLERECARAQADHVPPDFDLEVSAEDQALLDALGY